MVKESKTTLTPEQAGKLLQQHGQQHVLRFWERLNAEERAALLRQVAALDFDAIARMRQELARHLAGDTPAAAAAIIPAPVTIFDDAGRTAAATAGEAALRAGRVAVVLVAGGQGSRLGFDGPKGAYPIGPVSNAPLFHFHARKILALKRRYGQTVPLYIMTSEGNDSDTRRFFAAHDNFGLPAAGLFFFVQGMWPALDASGRIMLDTPHHIFMSPDGHGGTLSALAGSGALADMRRRGVDTVFYFQVDNPLVEVADPAFIGFHLGQEADVSVKVCAKRDAQEGLGVVVMRNGRHAMVEYTELGDTQKNMRAPDGDLYFKYGSVAIHVFNLDFLLREATGALPLHVAHKKIPYCDDNGATAKPQANNGYKFEKFIFDVLPDAGKAACLAFERADEFAPVKNSSGNDSPDSCRAALQAKWRRWLRAAGVAVPENLPVEIDPAYASTAADLRKGLRIG